MAGTILAADTTKSTVSIARDRGEIVDTYGKTKGEAFIVENTTAPVLSYYIGTAWRNENTIIVIPKMYIPREISPAALAGLKNKLSDLSRVQTITRVAFDEPSFREAYHAVDDRFDEVSKRPLLGFWFARWELSEKSSGSKPASPGT